jgi:hypothetical protein
MPPDTEGTSFHANGCKAALLHHLLRMCQLDTNYLRNIFFHPVSVMLLRESAIPNNLNLIFAMNENIFYV